MPRDRPDRSPSRPPRRPRLLIVEDEFFIALDLEQVLLDAGFEVAAIATDGDTALRLAEQFRPDLVLMDVRLRGGSDGVRTSAQVWSRLRVRSLFVTGNVELVRAGLAAEPYAAGFVAKPYDAGQLVAAVRAALPRRD